MWLRDVSVRTAAEDSYPVGAGKDGFGVRGGGFRCHQRSSPSDCTGRRSRRAGRRVPDRLWSFIGSGRRREIRSAMTVTVEDTKGRGDVSGENKCDRRLGGILTHHCKHRRERPRQCIRLDARCDYDGGP